MKAKERDEARRMRSEEGLSVGEIARRLGVPSIAIAPVAQLDRVVDYESTGRGFDSL